MRVHLSSLHAMQTHRFFIRPESWSPDRLELDQDEAHHCIDVIRATVGQRIVVFNGRGLEAVAEISGIAKSRVQLKTLQISQTPSLPCAITLAQAIPKGKNMELIVQKATELGVSKIVPLISERTVVQVEPDEAEKKTEKWRQIVIEAGKEIGLEYREDVNDLTRLHNDCIGWCQQTRGGRRRAPTQRTFARIAECARPTHRRKPA